MLRTRVVAYVDKGHGHRKAARMGSALFIFFRMALHLELGFWSIFLTQLIWALPFSLLLVIVGAGLFSFLLSFSELPRSLFVRGLSTTMPIYNWAMAASQQSNVPIIIALTTLTVLLTLPLVGVLFWIMFVRLDSSK
jgi:ABC-type spermidine/putrescine transport system permease subunit II